MQHRIAAVLRSAGAVVAGYAVIVIGTTLTLAVLLEGVSYAEASPWEHVVGAAGTSLSGFLGGYVAAWIAPRKPLWHVLAVAFIVALETTWIVANSVGSNPAWFDTAGGLTLMVTALLGGWVSVTLGRRRVSPAAV